MSRNKTPRESIRGTVEAVNDKGVKVDGEWYNFSKYDEVDIPNEGDEVELEVAGKWIKNLTFIEERREKKNQNKTIDKDTRITRLALLNTATSILTTHGKPVEIESVINTAHVLETYVYEERQSEEDQDVPF
jgi:hypothetical protein